jgi:hypothetical protein
VPNATLPDPVTNGNIVEPVIFNVTMAPKFTVATVIVISLAVVVAVPVPLPLAVAVNLTPAVLALAPIVVKSVVPTDVIVYWKPVIKNPALVAAIPRLLLKILIVSLAR